MSKILVLLVFFSFTLLSSAFNVIRYHSNKIKAENKGDLCSKPKSITPVNQTLADMNFFLGTGAEFRFRAHGKFVKQPKNHVSYKHFIIA